MAKITLKTTENRPLIVDKSKIISVEPHDNGRFAIVMELAEGKTYIINATMKDEEAVKLSDAKLGC